LWNKLCHDVPRARNTGSVARSSCSRRPPP
jgi:hypothetical protein